ncbi:hypothetical protein E3O19_05645 [Cryobacterium algoritolerans]|uniref:Uncharacterized protein n=1 Tax=Cryobacterium algoritolerans TaxID=1259184 RepID=A0A4R8WX48_9MICO|nr:hypothetical protein [Cryobacterium algoritolerans]TFC17806.1 hypothetical protein E3O19_05645 [Cryobacterium algoritolerans]
MTMDPDGLWPRRADAANDGLDEDRDLDDVALTLNEDLPIDPDADERTVDADGRSVDFDFDDDDDRDDDDRDDDDRDDDDRDADDRDADRDADEYLS